MAITLDITFVGLVAFAEDARDKKLFALLPATGSAGVHQHHAWLAYADPQPSAGDEDDADGASHEHGAAAARRPTFQGIPLGGKRVRFPGLAGTGTRITPPDTAAPLMEYGKGPLDRVQVGASPRDSVHALIELPGADAILPGAARTARWRVGRNGTKKHYLSHMLNWKREITDNRVHIVIEPVKGGGDASEIRFQGQDGDTIELFIIHVPDSSNDHPVKHNDPADHFRAYHALYMDPSGELPHLDQKPGPARLREEEQMIAGGPRGANVFSCMTAKVPVEP